MTKTAAEEKKDLVETTEDIEPVAEADLADEAIVDANDKPAEADDSPVETVPAAEAGDLLAGIDEAWLTAKTTTKEMLVEKCQQLGLDDGGKKAPLAARIRKLLKPQYYFPSKVKHDRCGTTNNIVTSTQGSVQYRKCRVPTCTHDPFAVFGKKVK